jgi:hypothetical protein
MLSEPVELLGPIASEYAARIAFRSKTVLTVTFAKTGSSDEPIISTRTKTPKLHSILLNF